MIQDFDQFYRNLLFRKAVLPNDNPSLLKDFLDSVCRVEPKVNEILSGSSQIVVDSGTDESTTIINAVTEISRSTPALRPILEEYSRKYGLELAQEFIDDYRSCAEPKVLFVAAVPYFQLVRISIALRRRGIHTYLLNLNLSDTALTDLHDASFDRHLTLPDNLLSLGAVLDAVEAPLIYLQVSMAEFDFPISSFVLENKGPAKCVCEFYDVLSLYYEKEILRRYFPDATDYHFHVEDLVFEKGDAFTCRFHPSAIEELRRNHGTTKEIVEFHPYPLSDFSTYTDEKESDRDGLIRLVYTGRITELNINGEFAMPEIRLGGYLLETFRRITAQGLAVELFTDPHFNIESREGFELYMEMAMMDPFFSVNSGYPPHELAREINKFDFGLNILGIDKSKLAIKETQFMSVGTKIFTYLEAGIPVIVSREWEYISEIVEENGLGMALLGSEIEQLGQRIECFDYDQSVESIQKFNIDNSLQIHIEKLTTLFESLIPDWHAGTHADRSV